MSCPPSPFAGCIDRSSGAGVTCAAGNAGETAGDAAGVVAMPRDARPHAVEVLFVECVVPGEDERTRARSAGPTRPAANGTFRWRPPSASSDAACASPSAMGAGRSTSRSWKRAARRRPRHGRWRAATRGPAALHASALHPARCCSRRAARGGRRAVRAVPELPGGAHPEELPAAAAPTARARRYLRPPAGRSQAGDHAPRHRRAPVARARDGARNRFERMLPRAVVWTDGGDELLVLLDSIAVETDDGIVTVGVDVACDQVATDRSPSTRILVDLIVGTAERPTGVLAAAPPRGHRSSSLAGAMRSSRSPGRPCSTRRPAWPRRPAPMTRACRSCRSRGPPIRRACTSRRAHATSAIGWQRAVLP